MCVSRLQFLEKNRCESIHNVSLPSWEVVKRLQQDEGFLGVRMLEAGIRDTGEIDFTACLPEQDLL